MTGSKILLACGHIQGEKAVMKTTLPLSQALKTSLVCTTAAVMGLSFSSCKVKKTEEGRAPSVDVDAGKMPKYDVDTAKVTVGTKEEVVTVPKVTTEEKTVTVPDVKVTMPGDATPIPEPAMTPMANP